MKIRHPPRPTPTSPIILYLPSGLASSKGNNGPDHKTLVALSLSAHATIVHIGYRLSSQSPYPKPIQDVLASYDWVLKHLIPSATHNSFPPSPRIGVCGKLIGGSLAAMLALTESHAHKRGAIAAAALGNPIVDWSSPLPRDIGSENGALKTDMQNLRGKAFARPEHRYDPFASPLLFLRTPAYELPTPSFHSSSSLPPPRSSNPGLEADVSALVPKRRSHRKYPPIESNLRLPATRVEIGTTNPLREQGVEFAELMRRSVDLYERGDGKYGGAGSSKSAGKERVVVVERQGEGSWEEKEMAEIGGWLGQALRSKSGLTSSATSLNDSIEPDIDM